MGVTGSVSRGVSFCGLFQVVAPANRGFSDALRDRSFSSGEHGYSFDMEERRGRWSERFGRWSTATHGRRIASFVAMLALGVIGTVWLVSDPGDAFSGPRGFGTVLAPVLVVLMLVLLVIELRTGDSR
jgi:hypothetical protein